MNITGTVHHVGEVQSYGQKGFRKREVVIDNGNKYDPYIPVEFTGDMADDFSQPVGAKVEVRVAINGRKWQKDESSAPRYFPSIRALELNILEESKPETNPAESGDIPF